MYASKLMIIKSIPSRAFFRIFFLLSTCSWYSVFRFLMKFSAAAKVSGSDFNLNVDSNCAEFFASGNDRVVSAAPGDDDSPRAALRAASSSRFCFSSCSFFMMLVMRTPLTKEKEITKKFQGRRFRHNSSHSLHLHPHFKITITRKKVYIDLLWLLRFEFAWIH